MTTRAPVGSRGETADYSRIVAARFDEGRLFVTFANGDHVCGRVDRFENPYLRRQALKWPRVRARAHEVVVPAAGGDVGIPWDTVRALTDPDFPTRWSAMGRSVSAALGAGIGRLRIARGLSLAELAERAGVPGATVEEVESGDRPADLDLAMRILRAMGGSLDDLAGEG